MAANPQGPILWAETLPAGADLSAKQFYFVKRSANTYVLCSAITDVPDGVLQNKPESGEMCEVLAFGPTKLCVVDATAVGTRVSTDANGRGVVAASTSYVAGKTVHAHVASVTSYPITSAFVNLINPPLMA